jgi:hypothetical protein
MGTKFEHAATHRVGPGDMMIMAAGVQHFGWTAVEVLLQLHGIGPWGVTYVDPADDPRRKQTQRMPASDATPSSATPARASGLRS